MRRLLLLTLALLLQGCAVARWHVPMAPQRGQSEARQRADAEECDTRAKAGSGYDRGVEAKTWLWGVPAAVGIATTWATKTAIDSVTIWPVPQVQDTAAKTTDAIIATKPKGTASWSGYFQAYRQCMSGRGYKESR